MKLYANEKACRFGAVKGLGAERLFGILTEGFLTLDLNFAIGV